MSSGRSVPLSSHASAGDRDQFAPDEIGVVLSPLRSRRHRGHPGIPPRLPPRTQGHHQKPKRASTSSSAAPTAEAEPATPAPPSFTPIRWRRRPPGQRPHPPLRRAAPVGGEHLGGHRRRIGAAGLDALRAAALRPRHPPGPPPEEPGLGLRAGRGRDRHEPPRHRRRPRDQGGPVRRAGAAGRADRLRSGHRPGAVAHRRAGGAAGREAGPRRGRARGAAGAGHRQPLQPRPLPDRGRGGLQGALAGRHPAAGLLSADRHAHQPRQLRRPGVQLRRRGHRGEHPHLRGGPGHLAGGAHRRGEDRGALAAPVRPLRAGACWGWSSTAAPARPG